MGNLKLIFDLIGVITEEEYIATKLVYPLVEKSVSYDLFKKKYLLYCIDNIDRSDFWQGIVPEVEISLMEEEIISRVALNLDVVELIKDYNNKGVNIFLASEIPAKWGEMILAKAGLKDVFKEKFYSSTLRSTKPFKNYYDKIFKPEFMQSSHVIYIDDTNYNVEVVRGYGAEAIWFNKTGEDGLIEHLTAGNAKEIKNIIG